jgi:hypothetical protein
MRRMRPMARGKALLRVALAVAFGVVSLHGPVMAFAKGSAGDHEISAAHHAPDHSASHLGNDQSAPQAPENHPTCFPAACCVGLTPTPASPAVGALALLGELDPPFDQSVASANPAPPDPPPRFQA